MNNQEKTYTVYQHVNKTNGKKYIGATSMKPEKRWGWQGSNYFHQPFWDVIKEFGWDGFTHEILAEGLTAEAANRMESQLIAECGDNCYNVQKGGGLHSGYSCFTHG